MSILDALSIIKGLYLQSILYINDLTLWWKLSTYKFNWILDILCKWLFAYLNCVKAGRHCCRVFFCVVFIAIFYFSDLFCNSISYLYSLTTPPFWCDCYLPIERGRRSYFIHCLHLCKITASVVSLIWIQYGRASEIVIPLQKKKKRYLEPRFFVRQRNYIKRLMTVMMANSI